MGAQESNAGDDFHFWWAASRALALIEPGTDSRLLAVEGLARIDDPDDEYEIVDVAEADQLVTGRQGLDTESTLARVLHH